MSTFPARRASLSAAFAVSILAAVTLAAPRTVLAHHAFAAEYDSDKPVEISGFVTKAKWVNPHGRLEVDVKNANGTVSNWSFEFGAPNALEGHGLTKADVQPGTKVTVKGFQSKGGGPFGYSVTLILADGRTFQTGGAPDAPPPGTQAGKP